MSRISLAPGVVVEDLGSELLVMVPGDFEVITLSGPAADLVRQVLASQTYLDTTQVSELARFGVFECSGLSRRGLIKAGAIGAGAGIAVMAMPAVAAATSESFDYLGYWGEIYDPSETAGGDDTTIGVNFVFDSDTALSAPVTLLIDSASVALDGEETDWVAIDASLPVEFRTGRTDYSYSFESKYPGTLGNRATTLEPDDAVYRDLVQRLIKGTAGGSIFGTVTSGTLTFRIKFEFISKQ